MAETDTDDFIDQQPSSQQSLLQKIPLLPQSVPSVLQPGYNLVADEYNRHKLVYNAAIAALVFVIVSLPLVYNYTGKLAKYANTEVFANNCPTSAGKFAHSVIFFVLIYVICKIHNAYAPAQNAKSNAQMAKHAFYTSLLFFVLSSTDAYIVSRKLVKDVADANGCPSVKGILLHSIVFIAAYLLVGQFPKDQ